jgi:hypothetical protein
MAFHADGNADAHRTAAGLALHAVETAAGIAVGAMSFLSLLVATRGHGSPIRHRAFAGL